MLLRRLRGGDAERAAEASAAVITHKDAAQREAVFVDAPCEVHEDKPLAKRAQHGLLCSRADDQQKMLGDLAFLVDDMQPRQSVGE